MLASNSGARRQVPDGAGGLLPSGMRSCRGLHGLCRRPPRRQTCRSIDASDASVTSTLRQAWSCCGTSTTALAAPRPATLPATQTTDRCGVNFVTAWIPRQLGERPRNQRLGVCRRATVGDHRLDRRAGHRGPSLIYLQGTIDDLRPSPQADRHRTDQHYNLSLDRNAGRARTSIADSSDFYRFSTPRPLCNP